MVRKIYTFIVFYIIYFCFICIDIMECMVCFDNVVRVGFILKYRDVYIFCEMLDYIGKLVNKIKFLGKFVIENGVIIIIFSLFIRDFVVKKF